jgi:uncharacterized protein (TIGR03435 family)
MAIFVQKSRGPLLYIILAVSSTAVGDLVAQGIDLAPSAASFAAASVKKNESGTEATGGSITGGRFQYLNETVVRLIGEAYGAGQPLPAFKIVGGPDWIASERYDVNAVADGNPTREELRAMARRLLAERFNFRAHIEQRETQVYALVLDRADGRLGPQLRPSETPCRQAGTLSAGANQLPPCLIRFGRGTLSGTGMTLGHLAGMGLSRYVGRDVVDRTGVAGAFDWTLTWTPAPLAAAAANEPAAAPTDDGVSIFTAVREQLGLKLEAARAPMDVLVIDRVDRPTSD